MSINILDCTLRDGGYYNLWNFKLNDVQEYINKISKSKIKIIEIGFKFFKKNPKFGKLAFVDESYLSKLKIPEDINIAIMINGQDLVNLGDQWKSILENSFKKNNNNKIEIIRIAVHYEEIFKISNHIKYLKLKGYRVFINLMQINKISNNRLRKFLVYIKKIKSVEVFYFADSLGCLRAENIKKICRIIKKNWTKPFGVHAHDNCGFALLNTLESMNNGAKWLDATIQGMGRGAGNVKTESLVSELLYRNLKNINYVAEPLFELAQGYFLEKKKRYNWGSSIYYNLAANYNIHPTYIQEILFENRYSHKKIIDIINLLRKTPSSSSFNTNLLKNNLFNEVSPYYWDAKNYFKNRIVLIVGQGPSIKDNKDKILRFIKNKNSVTFCLNINKFLFNKNYYNIISHEVRALVDQIEYKKLHNIIMPTERLKSILNKLNNKNIKNYGLITTSNRIHVMDSYCELPNSFAIGYALAICKASSAKEVYLVGFDGYSEQEQTNLEMSNYFQILLKYFKELNIRSLTNSRYNLPTIKF